MVETRIKHSLSMDAGSASGLARGILVKDTRSATSFAAISSSSDAGAPADSSPPEEIIEAPPTDKAKRLTIRRGLNRFSRFVNTGAEDFLCQHDASDLVDTISSSAIKNSALADGADKPHHLTGNADSRWVDDGMSDQCDLSITGNLVKTKYAGTMRFVAYQIFDGVSNSIVYRRYKQFTWLDWVLRRCFPSLCLPPLPDRQMQGRFENEFVESRQRALERYLRRLAAHPVVRTSQPFQLFIKCTDQADWKAGKRRAESMASKGPQFLSSIYLPSEFEDDDPVNAEDQAVVSKFSRFTRSMTTHCLALWDALQGLTMAAPAMEHIYLRLAFSMKRLVRGNPRTDQGCTTNADGNWCWKEDCEQCARLTTMIDQTFMAVRDMAIFWESNVCLNTVYV
jgi:sorting nexin-9/18/33